MPEVSYRISLDYLRDPETGEPFSGLWMVVVHPGQASRARSPVPLGLGCRSFAVRPGQIAHGIGLGLQRGDVQVFSASSGAKLAARLHRVRLRHEDLGEFELRVGFSESNSRANLLGRDFFNLFHVGFQERRSTLLFSPED